MDLQEVGREDMDMTDLALEQLAGSHECSNKL